MAFVSGVTNTTRFLQDIARVLVTANKDELGEVDPDLNWRLVYPSPAGGDVETALAAIEDRFILATTTSPQTSDQPSEYSYEPDRTVSTLTMYLEVRRPDRVINPDTGVPFYRSINGNLMGTRENVFYVEARLFDRLNETNDGMQLPVYDTEGHIVDPGAHYSEWVKLSWARDWTERRKDELDSDPGTTQLQDGILLYPTDISIPGNVVTITYWCRSDNDGFVLVVEGDKALLQDDSLTSFLYVGRLDPMESTQVADIGGNFAITSGSSTVPAWISEPPKTPPSISEVTMERGTGTLQDDYIYSYVLTYTTDGGESVPSNPLYVAVPKEGTSGNANVSVTIALTVPQGATSWRLYRQKYRGAVNIAQFQSSFLNNMNLYKLVVESFDPAATSIVDDGSWTEGQETPLPIGRPVTPVLRDTASGAIVSVRMPATWGPNTATGVTDIAVYKSRYGAYFQRHVAAFQAGEPYQTVATIGRQPSAWTGKFHVSPIYVAHPVEGWRGKLRWLLAVFDHGLIDGDELVVNKDQPDEERYRYFKITAPFSFFQSSPSERHSLALLKS